MGQRPALLPLIFTLIPLLLIATSCDRPAPTSAAPRTPTTRLTTVASLSPAATQIILLALDGKDRLVAVSNFDPPTDATRSLPRVGDYQTTDWERLAGLRPNVMITQFAANRLPKGMTDRAAALKIQLLNVPITRLDDILSAITNIADAIDLHDRGLAVRDRLRARLDAVAARTTGRKVRALIVVDDNGTSAVGRDNYLDDLLSIAGGQNVIPPNGNPYPSIDREMLFDLDPEVVFQLVPDASPRVIGRTRAMWAGMPNLQAVRNGRVHLITAPYAMRPTHQVAELAEEFAAALNECRGAMSPSTKRLP